VYRQACFDSVRTYSVRIADDFRMRRRKRYIGREASRRRNIAGETEWNCRTSSFHLNFNLKSATSSIVTNTANLNIVHRMTIDIERLNAVRGITHPITTAAHQWKYGLRYRDTNLAPRS